MKVYKKKVKLNSEKIASISVSNSGKRIPEGKSGSLCSSWAHECTACGH